MSGALPEVLRKQGRLCAALGSPMYAELLDRLAADVEAGGVFAEVLAGHEDDPIGSGIALRLLGGVHRIVLDGLAPGLLRWYPSVGGTWEPAAYDDVVAAAREHRALLRSALDGPPQTNDVGRAAALIGALLHLSRRFPYPIRLFEIGASAGLNLRADRYLYRYDGGQWGPERSPVVIDDAWRGRRPPDVALRIIERHGFDLAPVDAASEAGRLTLLSYVWPDMTARLARLRGALEVARQVPAGLDRMSAADAVAGLRVVRGTLTVLWHSVTWQYLGEDQQAGVAAAVAALSARTDEATPFVWLSLEPQRRAPDARTEFVVRARCWPDGTDEILGVSAPHGPPVVWD
jgi:hypothetical protein